MCSRLDCCSYTIEKNIIILEFSPHFQIFKKCNTTHPYYHPHPTIYPHTTHTPNLPSHTLRKKLHSILYPPSHHTPIHYYRTPSPPAPTVDMMNLAKVSVRTCSTKPTVCPKRRRAVLDRMLRVDHAGEIGAVRIYEGQLAVLGNTEVGPVIRVSKGTRRLISSCTVRCKLSPQ